MLSLMNSKIMIGAFTLVSIQPRYKNSVVEKDEFLRWSTSKILNYSLQKSSLKMSKGNDDDVKVGTKEYYAGFVSRDLQEAEERVAGDKVLIPTLKFVGGFTVLIGLLLVGFLASNGII